MKYHSIEESKNIIKNKKLLKEEIKNSKGFFLYMVDKYELEIDAEILIETLCFESTRYISEDIKKNKKKYTEEQIKVFNDLISEKEHKTIYSLEELIIKLKNKESFPYSFNIDKKLNLEDFLKNQEILSELLNIDKSDYSDPNRYRSNNILYEVFSKMNKKDFLKINKKLLIKNPSFFYMAEHLMMDREIKKIFNYCIKKNMDSPEIKKNGYKLSLSQYEIYNFEENEKDLFYSLLKNSYLKEYIYVSKLKGVNQFLEKIEYTLNNDIQSISNFTKKEIEQNIESIHSRLEKENYFYTWREWKDVFRLDIHKESFEKIFTKEFVEKMILKHGFNFLYIERECSQDQEAKIKEIIEKVFELASESKKIRDSIGISKIIKFYNQTYKNKNEIITDEITNNFNLILSNFSETLNTKFLFEQIKESNLYEYKEYNYNYDISKKIIESMNGKESINYLYFLFSVSKEEKTYNKKYEEETIRVIKILNKKDVLELAEICNYDISLKDKLMKLSKKNQRQDFDYNFLNFNKENITNLNLENAFSIFQISERFRRFISENNMENIFFSEKKNNNDKIHNMLRVLENNDFKYEEFLKKTIEKNYDFIIKNYRNEIITNKHSKKIININVLENEKTNYKEIIDVLNEYVDLSLERIKLENMASYNSEENIQNLIENIKKNHNKINEQIKQNISNISYDFYKEKIINEDIDTSLKLFYINDEYKKELFEKIEKLSFEETKSLIENSKLFVSILINYSKKEDRFREEEILKIKINPKFSDRQNIEIIEYLYEKLNQKDYCIKRYEKNVKLIELLRILKKEKRSSIIKEMVIKHEPEEMLNSYDYFPLAKKIFTNDKDICEIERYTKDEIIEAIENTNKKNKSLIYKENISYDSLISQNYDTDRNNITERKKLFLEYKEILKHFEKEPVTYLSLCHNQIMNNFITEDYEYRDIAISKIYNDEINIEIIKKAIVDIFEMARKDNNNKKDEKTKLPINVIQGIKMISSFLAYTYYTNSKEELYSEFDYEKTKDLIKLIAKNNPAFLISQNSIGKISSIANEISNNFHEYYSENMIDELFVDAKNQVLQTYFTVDYSKKENSWQSKNADTLIKGLINYFTNNKKVFELENLSFIIKEHQFNEENFSWSRNYSNFNGQLTYFLNNKEYIKTIEKSLLLINLKEDLEIKKKITKRNKI